MSRRALRIYCVTQCYGFLAGSDAVRKNSNFMRSGAWAKGLL
jgi:hypothetical protein